MIISMVRLKEVHSSIRIAACLHINSFYHVIWFLNVCNSFPLRYALRSLKLYWLCNILKHTTTIWNIHYLNKCPLFSLQHATFPFFLQSYWFFHLLFLKHVRGVHLFMEYCKRFLFPLFAKKRKLISLNAQWHWFITSIEFQKFQLFG